MSMTSVIEMFDCDAIRAESACSASLTGRAVGGTGAGGGVATLGGTVQGVDGVAGAPGTPSISGCDTHDASDALRTSATNR
jgi:hypothetical protein